VKQFCVFLFVHEKRESVIGTTLSTSQLQPLCYIFIRTCMYVLLCHVFPKFKLTGV